MGSEGTAPRRGSAPKTTPVPAPGGEGAVEAGTDAIMEAKYPPTDSITRNMTVKVVTSHEHRK